MSKIQIITGSVSGNALRVSRCAEQALIAAGHDVEYFESFSEHTFDTNGILLLCCATTGNGDLPENIWPFYSYINSQYPNISQLRYGIIALGNSSYANFCGAGIQLDEALGDLGATRIGDILKVDAIYCDAPAEDALPWLQQWEKLLVR